MIKVKDLWVGDLLKIKSTGEVGTFSKEQDNWVVVDVNGFEKNVKASDLELYEADKIDYALQSLENDPPSPLKKGASNPEKMIDLHLEMLPPFDPRSGLTEIEYQLRHCKSFIESVIKSKLHSAIIIHGKGKGILKKEVLHLLEGYKEVRFTYPTHNGGAVERIMMYH